MADLPVVRAAECVRTLERAGFVRVRQRGSHLFMEHEITGRAVTVPVHAGDIKPTLLRSIIRDAGLTVDEFIRRL